MEAPFGGYAQGGLNLLDIGRLDNQRGLMAMGGWAFKRIVEGAQAALIVQHALGPQQGGKAFPCAGQRGKIRHSGRNRG